MSEESKQKVREVARGMRTRRMMAGGAVGAALLASVASGAVFITSSSAASTHHSSSTSHSAATAPTVAGTVTAVDVASDSFTLKSEDGTTTTVDVTSTTTYEDRTVTSASLSDVAVGDMVAVVGTTASGVVTATDVRIGTPPTGAGFGGPGGPGGPGAPQGASSQS